MLGTLSAINVSQIASDASSATSTDAAQSNVSSAGHLVIVTSAGSLTTLAGGGAITAAGNLLLQASGAASDITLGASVSNSASHTSVNAARAILRKTPISPPAPAARPLN